MNKKKLVLTVLVAGILMTMTTTAEAHPGHHHGGHHSGLYTALDTIAIVAGITSLFVPRTVVVSQPRPVVVAPQAVTPPVVAAPVAPPPPVIAPAPVVVPPPVVIAPQPSVRRIYPVMPPPHRYEPRHHHGPAPHHGSEFHPGPAPRKR